jgi:hypothetical protein
MIHFDRTFTPARTEMMPGRINRDPARAAG